MAEKKNYSKKNVKKTLNNVKKEVKKEVKPITKEIEKKTQEVVKEVKEPIYGKKDNNKKWALIGALAVVLLLVCVVTIKDVQKDNTNNNVSSNMTEWVTETKEDKYVVTVIGLTYCKHCKNYNPVISKLAKDYDFKLYWFDIDAMSEEDSNTLTTTYELQQYTGASPYTVITKNGEFVADYVGGMPESETKTFLQDNGVID